MAAIFMLHITVVDWKCGNEKTRIDSRQRFSREVIIQGMQCSENRSSLPRNVVLLYFCAFLRYYSLNLLVRQGHLSAAVQTRSTGVLLSQRIASAFHGCAGRRNINRRHSDTTVWLCLPTCILTYISPYISTCIVAGFARTHL